MCMYVHETNYWDDLLLLAPFLDHYFTSSYDKLGKQRNFYIMSYLKRNCQSTFHCMLPFCLLHLSFALSSWGYKWIFLFNDPFTLIPHILSSLLWCLFTIICMYICTILKIKRDNFCSFLTLSSHDVESTCFDFFFMNQSG